MKDKVGSVIAAIGDEVDLIYAVDDKCPEGSGAHLRDTVDDPRLTVLFHETNRGVGGAVKTGYRAALDAGADIMVKVDGDGQMAPHLIPLFLAPIVGGEADYTKGNRFHALSSVSGMPKIRLIGNALLSFMTKLSSGYWRVFDPTNGYTAIHRKALMAIDIDSVAERYFFETDLLIKLGDARAVITDVPMHAVYEDEKSSLNIRKVSGEFLLKHMKATARRFFYGYFIRDFNIASLNLLIGSLFLGFGIVFGLWEWGVSIRTDVPAPTGTIMLAVLPIMLGVQMLLFFFSFDMQNEPRIPLQNRTIAPSLEGSFGLLHDHHKMKR